MNETKLPPVVACGDSITFGSGASEGHDWPTLVQEALGDDYLVINRGASGTTASDWVDKAWEKSAAGLDATSAPTKAVASFDAATKPSPISQQTTRSGSRCSRTALATPRVQETV